MAPSTFALIFIWFLATLVGCRRWESQSSKALGTDVTGTCSIKKLSAEVPRSPGGDENFSMEKTLFGTEIEFPVEETTQEQAKDYLMNEVARACELAKCSCQRTGNEITFNSGQEKLIFYFDNDESVVEVTMPPMTYSAAASWAQAVDRLLFLPANKVAGKSFNYKNSRVTFIDSRREPNRWSGHVNVSWPGLRSTSPDIRRKASMLLLNFYVDTNNHPELAMGVLGGDIRNATPQSLGSRGSIARARERMNVLVGKFIQENPKIELSQLAATLYKMAPEKPELFGMDFRYDPRLVLVNTFYLQQSQQQWQGTDGRRVEIRGFFTPTSASQMLSNYRIINGRLNYLNNQRSQAPVSFKGNSYLLKEFKTRGLHSTEPMLTPDRAAEVYRRYLEEAGLNPTKESVYLTQPEVRKRLGAPSCLPFF